MSVPFLQLVAQRVKEIAKDKPENACVVLPGKRAAIFLRQHLATVHGKTLWLPRIISTEELMGEISGLQVMDSSTLVCTLYESYRDCYGSEAEPFEGFARWGQLMLNDFDEIDRYLADPVQLYENLTDIKEIENWSLSGEDLTPHQQRYIQFMRSLSKTYHHVKDRLLSTHQGWPGLILRQAAMAGDIEGFHKKYEHLFICGFNALSAAEIQVFEKLQALGNTSFIWDVDSYYLKDPNQEAGLFLRKNLERFGPKGEEVSAYFKQPKEVKVVSVPRQLGQAQVVRQQLQDLHARGVPFDKVAVVLANEKLLWPVLRLLPQEVEHLNITMEYPLGYTGSFDLLEALLHLQVSYRKHRSSLYHKDLSRVLRQPLFARYMRAMECARSAERTASDLARKNQPWLNEASLRDLFAEDFPKLSNLLLPAEPAFILGGMEAVVSALRNEDQNPKSGTWALEHGHLNVIQEKLYEMREMLQRYEWFHGLDAFLELFDQTLGHATVPFLGEPLQGLQVMGVLETRCLDFDHVIMVNVNEGVLPSGKTQNSFIPNDLKRAFGLPLYAEKDAVYAYHFYRLLQRANTIAITYDSETDTFGKGEKSRFVTQLLLEWPHYNSDITLHEEVAMYPPLQGEADSEFAMQKTEQTLERVVAKASDAGKYGSLSPSSLISFKQCHLRFYYRYGVGLSAVDEVLDVPDAGMFGTVLHRALEKLYTGLTGTPLSEKSLAEKLRDIPAQVDESFREITGRREASGKGLLQVEVIGVYVKKLVQQDMATVKKLRASGRSLSVLNLEHELSASLSMQVKGLERAFIKGKVDRIDRFAEFLRIVDYKSSVKPSDKFAFAGMDALFTDVDYDKQFQLFIYAWLAWKNNLAAASSLRPCIIPFKSFEEARYILGPDKKPLQITDALMQEFEIALQSFITQIFNADSRFTQTDDRNLCKFCDYLVVCHLQA